MHKGSVVMSKSSGAQNKKDRASHTPQVFKINFKVNDIHPVAKKDGVICIKSPVGIKNMDSKRTKLKD